MYRYAYVKNGDVVRQLERIEQAGDESLTSGPDGFLNSFLHCCGTVGVYLAGTGIDYRRHTLGNVEAETFREGRGKFRRLLGPVAAVKLLFHLITRRPDRIICGKIGPMLWMCLLAARVLRVPLVCSCHNSLIPPRSTAVQRLRAAIDAACIRRAKAVVCHGPFLAGELERIGVKCSKITMFDVDFSDIHAEQVGKAIDADRNTLVFIGRIEHAKGVFDLLEAAGPIIRENGRWSLQFVGGGGALTELKRAVGRAGLEKRAHCLGEVNHGEVLRLLERAAVVVAPTRPEFPEGRCMVVMEALMLGVPVLAPNFGPFLHLVVDGVNGRLFKAGDVTDLREKLNSMLDEAELSALRTGAERSWDVLGNTASFGPAVQKAFGEVA